MVLIAFVDYKYGIFLGYMYAIWYDKQIITSYDPMEISYGIFQTPKTC